MNALLLLFLLFCGYLVAYYTYGRFLARKIFQLKPEADVPSKTLADGKDFVESSKHIMFGHHFTSIAGTGPIVGPAIGVIWGWVPAILWVFIGSIFMGAVHDFGSLLISVRNEGRSISDITSKYINSRVRRLFFFIVFLSLLIVIAIFGLVIALIFKQFPQSVIPVWFEIPLAIGLGKWAISRSKHVVKATLFAVFLMYVTVVIGAYVPVVLPSVSFIPATGLWTIILLIYAFIASVLPVKTLLQPRDFMNAWQLYVALGIILVGIVVTGFSQPLDMVAPAVNLNPVGAPPIWPFLFITIACGAVSGFHCLVCSGTSSKQIASESDTQFIGYGAMLMESFLASLIIVAVTAGLALAYTTSNGDVLSGLTAWQAHYGSWMASSGLGSKLTAVVIGCANFMKILHIPHTLSVAIVGVFIASFAGTTLDSATRVQRYVISELCTNTRFSWASQRYIATAIAVISAALLAFSSGANGKGALVLWPLFGAVNQLLAALALMVITVYIRRHKQGLWFLLTGMPCLIMTILTFWACFVNELSFISEGNYLLMIINGLILLLAFWMVTETVVKIKQG